MYDVKIPGRQLSAWLLAAIIPTGIQLTAGASWTSVLLASMLSLLCIWVRWTFGAEPTGKVIAILQGVLLVLLLGLSAQKSIQSWSTGEHPAVAIILLILAVWSVWKGTRAAARVGCTIFWFVLLLYLVLLGAGVKEVQLKWLRPGNGEVQAFGVVLMLTPALAANNILKEEKSQQRLLLIGVFVTAAAIITAGVLSPQVASSGTKAFYEMTRSLSLLGQARRFEAVLSAGMTAGWFLVFTIYLSQCAKIAETIHQGWGRKGVLLSSVAAIIVLLCELHIQGVLLLILCAIFWVLIPVLTQLIESEKKS